MHPFFQHPVVRRGRIIFRWCRISVWLALLMAVSFIAYLHLIGLPNFAKGPILQRLRAHGIAVEFSNLELGWGPEPLVIIDKASFSRAGQTLSPRLTTGRAEMELDWHALRQLQFNWKSLEVSDARLEVPVSATNGDSLLLENAALSLQFHSNDVAELNYCHGTFHGVQLDVIGQITHATEMQHWQFPGGGSNNVSSQDRLRAIADTLDKIHLVGFPELRIEAGGDGRDMNSFHANLNFVTGQAQTPWGTATNLAFNASCIHLVHPGMAPFLQVRWSASNIKTPWARGHKTSFSTVIARAANSNFDASVQFDANQFSIPLDAYRYNHFNAGRLSWNGRVTLASSNLNPLAVTGKLRALEPSTPWGSATELKLEGHGTPAPPAPAGHADWGPLTEIAGWTLDWRTEVRALNSPKLHIDQLSFAGHWLAPKIAVENVQADLYHGHVGVTATLDAGTRELRASGATELDPHSISHLLRPPESNWLRIVDWTQPPKTKAAMRIVLPPWTNPPADWAKTTEDSLQIAGDFTVGPASYYPVPVLSASGHVTYTNRTWNVTRIHALRPDGEADLDYRSGPEGYHYLIDSKMNPQAGMPLVNPSDPHILDDFVFSKPPVLHIEIWGRWRDPSPYAITGTVRAADFIARSIPVTGLTADVIYTNNLLTVRDFSVSNNQCQARAPWMQLDCVSKTATVTNASGWLDPSLLPRALGRQSPGFLDALHFDSPPSVSLSGTFNLTNASQVDVRFLVGTGPVHYSNFVADAATGEVDWLGPTVSLTNFTAALYNKGSLNGWLIFNTAPAANPVFRARLAVKDIDLASLFVGLTGKKTRVEGRLDGNFDLTGGDGWNRGRSYAHVHDALLWDIKVFGLFSPVLNLFSPGWGYSRAREAEANFTITNGTVRTDDLIVRCTGFVLKLRGTVNNNKQVNAKVEAVLSREVPLFGPLLSLAFTPVSKMMEYHVAGTLTEPTMEPVFVPKFILLLMHPFRSNKPPSLLDGPSSGPLSTPAANGAK